MNVYRVEMGYTLLDDIRSIGPYIDNKLIHDGDSYCEDLLDWFYDLSWAHTDGYHLAPGKDGIYHNESYSFGFKSLGQLKAWFSHQERENLSKLGYILNIYKVPEDKVKAGGRQVAFHYESAKIVKRVFLDKIK